MKIRVPAALAGASLAVLAMPFAAQAQTVASPAAAPAAAAGEAQLGEIVVTARRRSESLQEVPQVVNAVTADTLQKLNIEHFQDVQAVVPGLSLQQNNTGFQAAASLRGVTFDVNTGAQPTVAMYINDAPVQALYLFQSLYDTGQIEVLRGPQGTTRGVSAPSGAITLTTHKPNLSEFGGYVDGTLTDLQGRNVQGAINVPIIKDVLAIRAAGLVDQNDGDGVTSIHNNARPRQVTTSERIGVSFEPNDRLNANVTYQHIDKSSTSFSQVSGAGDPALGNPALSPEDRASVQDQPATGQSHFDLVTAQVDSRIFGQHLSYVGSYQHAKISTVAVQDPGDVVPGAEFIQRDRIRNEQTTHELRLASDPAPGRFFDYTAGVFYSWYENGGHIDNPGPLTPGAFGPPNQAPNTALFNPGYMIPITIDVPGTIQETSVFGSVTLHLDSKTELSGGIRHIWSVTNSNTIIARAPGKIALALPACSTPSIYAGFCDITIPGAPVSSLSSHTSETPNIYNVSLSHHFSRDFLVYANTGTSYRPPLTSIGIQGALANSTDPVLHALTFHPSERSRAYEVGFKSTFLDGRARLNAALFRQRFSNLPVFIPGISYSNNAGGVAVDNAFDFTASVDALVQGFDIDAALQVTRDWNISLQASYADGQIEGSDVPCNITGANGKPSYNTAGLISLCPGGSASRLPLWNATLQTEYLHPVTDRLDGFLRGLVTYYPQNRRAEPNFVVDAYSQVNIYAGVRSADGAWEASLFARNALGAFRELDTGTQALNANTELTQFFPGLNQPSGYVGVLSTTPRREVGINVHYAWGSR